MKLHIPFLTLVAGLLLVSCGGGGNNNSSTTAQSTDENVKKIYPIEHGTIYQKMTVMGIESEPIIYFDKWGVWKTTETRTEMKILNQVITDHKLEISKDKDFWEIDLEKKTGVKSQRYLPANSMGFDPEHLTDEVKKQLVENDMHLEELGDTTMLGFKCKNFHVTSKKWGLDMYYTSYGNIVMKMRGMAVGFPSTLEITKIETAAPGADKFEVPEGITIEEQKL